MQRSVSVTQKRIIKNTLTAVSKATCEQITNGFVNIYGHFINDERLNI